LVVALHGPLTLEALEVSPHLTPPNVMEDRAVEDSTVTNLFRRAVGVHAEGTVVVDPALPLETLAVGISGIPPKDCLTRPLSAGTFDEAVDTPLDPCGRVNGASAARTRAGSGAGYSRQ
jgi:hypothetical protein